MKGKAPSILALVCLSGGCSLVAPQPDRSQFFVLTSVAHEAGHVDGSLTLGIGPVLLPGYLTRLQVARRSGANQIVFAEDQVWGEPLEQGFRRVLAEDLGQTLGTVGILQYPWSTGLQVEYQIPIAIERFEADEHGTVALEARWAIRRPGQKDVLLSRESRIVETARDTSTAAVVAAMSEAVESLSAEMAIAIQRLATAGGRPR